MFLNQNQIEELVSIINYQHILFIASNVGISVLSDAEKEILKSFGIDVANLDQITLFEQSFRFGVLSQAIGHKRSENLTYTQFLNYIGSSNYQPLTEQESYALEFSKRQAAKDIRGLGNRVANNFQTTLIEIDQQQRNKYENIITSTTQKSVSKRESAQQLALRLGHQTDDWARDFNRIADYVMHDAFDNGRATQIQNQYGKDAQVYKNVFHLACKHCVKLYLTDGVGSQPILFKLKDIQANGTNIGRHTTQWKAVIGPTHPWCRCTLSYRDPNYDWSSETQSFNKPKEYQRRVQRRSKVTISIGNTTINV